MPIRKEVFERLDERIFEVRYNEEASHPNAPINILSGAELMKTGFGWTDLQLAEQITFNLQVRHSVALTIGRRRCPNCEPSTTGGGACGSMPKQRARTSSSRRAIR